MADTVTARTGDTLDALLWRERGLDATAIGPALDANAGIAAAGAILPAGTVVAVPAAAGDRPLLDTIHLWD